MQSHNGGSVEYQFRKILVGYHVRKIPMTYFNYCSAEIDPCKIGFSLVFHAGELRDPYIEDMNRDRRFWGFSLRIFMFYFEIGVETVQ